MRVRGAVLNALAYVAGGSIVDNLIFQFVPPKITGLRRSPLLPPGWIVGLVWLGLFAQLGIARSELAEHPHERRLLDAFYLFCLAYPLYTGGLQNRAMSYAGNVATIGAASGLAQRVRRVSPVASALLLPVIGWVGYATLGMLAEQEV